MGYQFKNHSELAMEYAKDMAKTESPWRLWEVKEFGSNLWEDLITHPAWISINEYRRKNNMNTEADTINSHFTLCEAAPDLLALAERVARLNPNCAEIGAGMLAQLHADAVAAIRKAKVGK